MLQGRGGTAARHTRRYSKGFEVSPMAVLLYVLLAVGYGLSVWSLVRQRRHTPPDRFTPVRPASASRTQLSRASVTRRSHAAAA